MSPTSTTPRPPCQYLTHTTLEYPHPRYPRHSYYLADFTRLLLSFSFYLSLFSCKKNFVKHRNITYAINILSLMLHEPKERYSISLHIQSRMRENTDQNNSEYGLFLRSAYIVRDKTLYSKHMSVIKYREAATGGVL